MELGALWEMPDLPKSNCAGPVLPGLLDLTGLEKFLLGALPPMVGPSFLQTGSSPKADGPASAAIWANCWVGNDDGDLPTSSSHLASSTNLSASSTIFSTSLVGEGFLAGDGWCTGEGAYFPFQLTPSAPPSSRAPSSPLSLLFWSKLCSCHSVKQTDRSYNKLKILLQNSDN